MVSSQDPDKDCIERAQGGELAAFNQLILKYRNRVVGIAARMLGDRIEAEDLAQDVFVKVYHGLRTFHGEALFSTWLYRITANSCLNHRKKRTHRDRHNHTMDDLEGILPTDTSNPHSLLERKELQMVLEKAIQGLPQDQKAILILRDIEGLSYEEIADSLEVELGTVRSRLHRARMAVRASLGDIFSNQGNMEV